MAVQWQKKKNELIDMEDIDPKERYAFTFNPNDERQFFNKSNRLGLCISELEKVFYVKSVYTLELYPEISKSGRFHVHGYIIIHDPVSWVLNIVHRLCKCGTVCIKKIDDGVKWQEYITKQKVLHEHVKLNHYVNIPIVRKAERSLVDIITDDNNESGFKLDL